MPTPRQVEEALAARIAALDASAHDQAPMVATWTASEVPLAVLGGPSSLRHLMFSVWLDSAPNSGQLYSHIDRAGLSDVELRATVRVVYTYQLRPAQQQADMRSAWDAALDVARALMGVWTESEPVTIDLVNLGRPALTRDGEYLLMTQEYTAQFCTPMSPWEA